MSEVHLLLVYVKSKMVNFNLQTAMSYVVNLNVKGQPAHSPNHKGQVKIALFYFSSCWFLSTTKTF